MRHGSQVIFFSKPKYLRIYRFNMILTPDILHYSGTS